MRNTGATLILPIIAVGLGLGVAGCDTISVFNPAFTNILIGGEVPLTPGPSASYVLVRCINETNQGIEFTVSIKRDVLETDEAGEFQTDETGEFITRSEHETVRLRTQPTGGARELGTLFPCLGTSPVTLVGLGEDLVEGDTHIAVGVSGTGGSGGSGVNIPGLNPLPVSGRQQPGDDFFNCGDTIIFRAFESSVTAGNVNVEVFLLPGSEQPFDFRGSNTFANFEEIQAALARDQEP